MTCYIDKNKMPKSKTNGKEIGLDFGIKTNITTSEGEKLDVSVEESERLKMLQKKADMELFVNTAVMESDIICMKSRSCLITESATN